MRKFILGTLLWSALLFLPIFARDVIIENEGILIPSTIERMQLIGDELEEKTGVYLGVVAVKSLNGKSVDERAGEFLVGLKAPYAFIFIATTDKKIDIYTSGVSFDKEEVLSLSPRKGTIIPIIVSTKDGNDPFNPALMNGYADIAEKISKEKGVRLESKVGNTNKIVLNLIRFFVYGSIILVTAQWLYYKIKRKKDE